MNSDSNSLNLEPGKKLAGVYLLQRMLETGGEPAIWLAQDEVLGKSVALHFLPTAVAKDERAIAEIRQEVKRTRPLIHPSILRVYDLVEGEGWAAVATDSFEGERLSAVIEEHGRYEVSEVDEWIDQVCVALEEAHRIKITHRDLAPENIFVTPKGRWLHGNFGIGRAVLNSLQRAGELAESSPRWSSASPQQLDSAAPSPSDDVYGVGALFFRLLTGEAVFSGGDVPAKIRTTTAPRVSDVRFESDDRGEPVPAGWENVIAACLNKSRDERPSRPSEIVSSIEAYAPVEPSTPAAKETAVSKIADEIPAAKVTEPETEKVDPETELEETPVEAALKLVDVPPVSEPDASSEKDAEISPTADEEESAETVDEAQPIETEPLVEPVAAVVAAAPVSSAEMLPPPVEAPKIEEPKAEIPAAPKREPVMSSRLYDTDEDAFSGILPKRFRFPTAVAAAVVLVLVLINSAFKDKGKPASTPGIATSDSAERGDLTPVKNTSRDTSSPTMSDTPEHATSQSAEAAMPAATAKAPDQPEMLVAAGPKTKTPAATPAPATPSPAMPDSDKQIAEKSAALEKLKADLAAADKQEQARMQEKKAADAAIADAEKALDEKSKAAAAAKKEAQDLVTARKQREDDQKAAELAAQAAQQLAAEKTRAAEEAKKAFADFEAKNREKLAAQDKAAGDLQKFQQTLDDQKKAAEESSRAAAAATAARQQQLAAIQQAETDLATARAAAAKSAEEAQHKVAVDSERHKLDDEIAAMRVLFEQKMKDIEDRRRQLESGAAKTAPAPAAMPAATPAPTMPKPSANVPVPEPPRPAAMATPAAPGLPLMASRTEPPPVPPAMPAATPAPVAPTTAGGTNSLGLRFAPVGDVQFSIWLTRWKDFDAFARAVNLKSTAWRGPGFRQGPDHPVVNVTWNEAIAFCKWLTDKEHKDGSLPANQFYRLPYDMEWSKGVGLPVESGKTPEARDMGVPDVYPWGTDWPPPKGAGNYTGEETGSDVAIKGYDDGFAWTSPVGSFPANKLGLYDMGGNVWQWCMDTWNADSKARVLRGASWYNGALKLSLLASCRVHATPDSSTDNYGFRIVKATETASAKTTHH